ncbi:hypothetical protein JQM82_03560 [Faecalicatena contorta]|nr:hypothetical protein [Faecalicatena contorta]
MQRFIRYLYEYEQARRLRNVGFVKVEQEDEVCTVHIHGKGFRMKGKQRLEVSLFYLDGEECVGIWQGTVENMNPAINYQLRYTREDTGVPENFERIDGILLEDIDGRRYAAVWDDLPVNPGRMRFLKPVLPQPEEPIPPFPENTPEEVTDLDDIEREMPEEITDLDDIEREMPEEVTDLDDIERMTPEEITDLDDIEREMPEELTRPEEECWPEEKAIPSQQPLFGAVSEDTDLRGRDYPYRCTKMQRQDLAKLPRCEWKLANNRFLLHGYFNYHHVVLIDDGNELRLGVPGIYHSQEARAAEAFGFPEFIEAENVEIDRSNEEEHADERFGYWCRKVRGECRRTTKVDSK